jgi:hypothetical protein
VMGKSKRPAEKSSSRGAQPEGGSERAVMAWITRRQGVANA